MLKGRNFDMERIKGYLLSEKGMRLVNIVFLLAFVVSNPFVSFFAGLLWLLFLYYSIRRTDSIIVKALYALAAVIALFIIALSVISLFQIIN